MKIITISYEELISGQDFSNKKIGATCQVDKNESSEDAFTNLVYWVKEQFLRVGVNPPELIEIENRIALRKQDLELVEIDIANMKNKWEKASEFLKKHGVEVDKYFDLPF